MGKIIVSPRMINHCINGISKKANKVLTGFITENSQHRGWVETSRQPSSISLIVYLNGPDGRIFLEKLTRELKAIFPNLIIIFSDQCNERSNFTYTIK